MSSSYGRELTRARRMNQTLGDERLEVIRQREERLKLRQGVRRFKLDRGFRCGNVKDLVIAQLLLPYTRDELTDAQREFRVMGLLHAGMLGTQACPACMPLIRLYGLYRTWWQEGVMLEDWERVSCLDPERMWWSEILQVARIIRRRLDFVQAVETQYDPETGKLHY